MREVGIESVDMNVVVGFGKQGAASTQGRKTKAKGGVSQCGVRRRVKESSVLGGKTLEFSSDQSVLLIYNYRGLLVVLLRVLNPFDESQIQRAVALVRHDERVYERVVVRVEVSGLEWRTMN